MRINYYDCEREEIKDMGKALQFILDFCGYREKCRECDYENACYNLFKIADEFVSIGEVKYESKHNG